jgi:hypothetical protein
MLPTLDRIYRPVRQENSALGAKYDPKRFSHFGTFGHMFAYLSKNNIFIGNYSVKMI